MGGSFANGQQKFDVVAVRRVHRRKLTQALLLNMLFFGQDVVFKGMFALYFARSG